MNVTQVGIFISQKPLDRKQLPVLQSLVGFYTDDVIKNVLLPIITHSKTSKDEKISLRALDWLVTNYSKKFPVIYKMCAEEGTERVVNIYSEYKTWLWKHRRSHFDPFRRRQRLNFTVDGEEYTTTVGQLNFMYWASRYGVLEYARAHLSEIERDHAVSTKNKQPVMDDKGGRKRRQLSMASRKKVFVYSAPVKISFNPGISK